MRTALQEWLNLPEQTKRNIFEETARKTGLPVAAAAEKDWWAVRTLELVFQTEIAKHTVFKGGTSLSKAWNLIDRFSEDIDLALDRAFLGFTKADSEMTRSQVNTLRKKSCAYISETFLPLLQQSFIDAGCTGVQLHCPERQSDDEDPIQIEVRYPSVTEKSEYLLPRVLLEIGSRSLIEPFTEKKFTSFVGEQFKGRDFADTEITIPVVNPERTFLEKIFLLHEEFQRPIEKIKSERRSRHFYDVEKMMNTKFGEKAFEGTKLYWDIVEHRRRITPIRGIDYDNHAPDKIRLVPPDGLREAWQKDYEQMQQSMIYGESLPFDKLMERITELTTRINQL